MLISQAMPLCTGLQASSAAQTRPPHAVATQQQRCHALTGRWRAGRGRARAPRSGRWPSPPAGRPRSTAQPCWPRTGSRACPCTALGQGGGRQEGVKGGRCEGVGWEAEQVRQAGPGTPAKCSRSVRVCKQRLHAGLHALSSAPVAFCSGSICSQPAAAQEETQHRRKPRKTALSALAPRRSTSSSQLVVQ